MQDECPFASQHQKEQANKDNDLDVPKDNWMTSDFLSRLLDAAPDAMILVTQESEIVFVNEQAIRLFGYPRNELLHKELDQLVPLLHRPRHKQNVEKYAMCPAFRPMSAGLDLTALHKRGHEMPVEVSLSPIQFANQFLIAASIRNISARKKIEEELRYASSHDSLTQLINRQAFEKHIAACTEHHKIDKYYQYAILFIDLDRFKRINDTYGHFVGDEILKAVAERMRATAANSYDTGLAQSDFVCARLGGDEFVIVLENIAAELQVSQVCDIFQSYLVEPILVGGESLELTTSIGVAISSENTVQGQDLLGDADLALYQAKANGKNGHAIFRQEMRDSINWKLKLEQDLATVLVNNELEVYYQPVIELESGDVVGLEALLRWHHPEEGLIPPAQFLPIAEETGKIIEIGEWVFRTAALQLAKWKQQYQALASIYVSVNVSKRQLQDQHFPIYVKQIMAETQLPENAILLEVSERLVMEDRRYFQNILGQLKSLNIQLAMDDFGTGYSSLGSLHELPLDVLKIDNTFIRNLTESRDYASVVHAIITLAHNLGFRVLAEGLENFEQISLLQALECDRGQGFAFSKPLPADKAEIYMLEKRSGYMGMTQI